MPQTDKSTKQQAVPGDVLKQQTNPVDYSFRIVVLGDCGVGKSSLINDEINDGQQQQQQQRTATGEKQQAVVNNQQPLLSIHNKTFLVNGQHCQIQLWDHNGSPTVKCKI
jgi:GTPase SAR1 family protein